jgi:hypothetical protein
VRLPKWDYIFLLDPAYRDFYFSQFIVYEPIIKMLTLHIAYTEPVNGNNSDGPILTREDVWNGLKLKGRRPELFIPSFDDSRVIEERQNGNVIVREAHVSADLHESPMAGKWVREECRLDEPVKVSAPKER